MASKKLKSRKHKTKGVQGERRHVQSSNFGKNECATNTLELMVFRQQHNFGSERHAVHRERTGEFVSKFTGFQPLEDVP